MLSENIVLYNKSKHIDIKFNYIRDVVHIGVVKKQYMEIRRI